MNRHFVSKSVLIAAYLVVAAPAGACSCLGDIDDALENADHVVVARVTSAKTDSLQFEVEFVAVEVLKGEIPSSPLFVTGMPSLLCGKSHISVGLRYLFFVDEVRSGGRTIMSASCQSFLLDSEEAEIALLSLRPKSGGERQTEKPDPRCEALSELQFILPQLRARYLDVHPDVIRTRDMIKLLAKAPATGSGEQTVQEFCAQKH